MQELLEEVLQLQKAWRSEMTDQMTRRGVIVERLLPEAILPLLGSLVVPNSAVDDFAVDGSRGAGPNAKVPWTRIFSKSRSRNAQEGFYLVFLFSATGTAAYLSLNQGTTSWRQGETTSLPLSIIDDRTTWARAVITSDSRPLPGATSPIDLEAPGNRLAPGYERGNVLSIRYAAGSVPATGQIEADLRQMAGELARIYLASDAAPQLPGEEDPNLAPDQDPATLGQHSRKWLRRRGYGLTKPERDVVEARAVAVASEFLASQGFDVESVGDHRSYDLDASRGDLHLFVEVKGSTSEAIELPLTANEVAISRQEHPNTVLIVVHGIRLERGSTPTASGGVRRVFYPWRAEDQCLHATAYRYRTPEATASVDTL